MGPLQAEPRAGYSVSPDFQPLGQLSALPASLLVCARDGSVLTATARAAALLDLDRAEFLGARLDDLVDVEIPGPDEPGRTAVVPRGDGPRPRFLEVELQPAYLPGIHGQVLAVSLLDVTERERAGTERDRLLQLAAVSEILPTVLHEIRNPLAAIRTMTELLVEEATDEALQNDLYSMLREVRRIQLTLQGIGTVGRTLHAPSPSAVDFAIEEAVRTLTPSASEKGISLTAEVEAMPLLGLDLSVVRGIVFNLVRNAIDACSPGDGILVRLGLDDPTTVRLEVADTGPGMPEDVIAHATELFFSTKRHGSGIGLALVHRSVDSAGGSFAIDSVLGEGTTIRMTIPTTPPHPQEPHVPR